MSMGKSSVENNDSERVMILSAQLSALSMKFFLAKMLRNLLEKLGFSLFRKEIMGVSHRFEKLLDRIILEHEEKLDGNQDKDLMDAFLEAYRDENAEYKITKAHIKSLFVELFLGATDTSATATHWTMAEILHNSIVFERLREELDSVVGKTRLIQETDLPNLPYLQAVVKEGLRMHPPIPVFVRSSQEGCRIGGFYIEEKTTLMVNTYAVIRDSNSWEDPNEFKPERFLASSRKEDNIFNYIPFGSGRRRCPGSNLGSIFVGTAIGIMVQCFDWEIKGDKVNMEEATGRSFLTMAHPLRGIPFPRIINPLPCNV
ncbi:Cytochrome [Cardamine amara subsp. amara]|uniref:Cytochrome n=1 Tax=Cardamine amara subsp. amara TaxID=228776 RepID=A0ABD1AEV0_CARAN